MFKVNEANWDRIARVVLGIILLFLGLGGTVTGVLGVVFAILGVILLVTGAVGVCPLYMLFKFSTKKS
jgi:membrane-bound ClpP family serine protease